MSPAEEGMTSCLLLDCCEIIKCNATTTRTAPHLRAKAAPDKESNLCSPWYHVVVTPPVPSAER